VHTLEHLPEWFTQMSTNLRERHVPGIELHLAPLVNRGSYAWYDVSRCELPSPFELVVCDGPPNETTLGSRYGLLPIMGARLPAGAVIVLDDCLHPAEVIMRRRWHSERAIHEEIYQTGDRAYAVLTLG
jgi:hypothetical protein